MLAGSIDGTMLELAMPKTADTIMAAEWALLDPGIRRDRTALDRLLAPEFREIGQSGRLWTRDEILDALTAADQAEFASVEVTDPDLVWLAKDLALLTYRLRVGERSSRRSSIWRVTPDGVVLVFHQGTAVMRGEARDGDWEMGHG
jgi:ribonuclease HI